MKRFGKIVLVSLLIFSLCGCSLMYEYENNAVGAFDLGYSQKLKKAFLASYRWDATEEGMTVTLPENYNGASITGLGGYVGRGLPVPFSIELSDAAKEKLCPDATSWWYANHTAQAGACNVQYLPFQLHISKNIQDIDNLSFGGIVLAEYDENGEQKYHVFVLTCYVTCDENNKTFYAKEGKLYFKKTDALVEDIIYADFDLEEHNEKYKDIPGFRSAI